ncbi:hypothetical protein [Alteromonas flava]|uniref:hypothetical protein n=1 Tax=Alteromonas flava TaxID=2048003 RepID=UPI000C281E0A|nr:hypothetical protein [Alteromonas flava]
MRSFIAFFCILALSFSAIGGGLSVDVAHGEHASIAAMHGNAACDQHAVDNMQSSSNHDCCDKDKSSSMASSCDEQCQTCCNDINTSHLAILTTAYGIGSDATPIKLATITKLPEAPHREPVIPPII